MRFGASIDCAKSCKKMNKEIVYSVVVDIQRAKMAGHIVPAHALYMREILPALPEYESCEVQSALNDLIKEKRMVFGRTINDLYFKAI